MLPTEAELIGPHAYTDEIRESLLEQAERDSRSVLEERAERVRSEGGKVAETHSGWGDRTRRSSDLPGCWGWDDHVGQPGTRRAR